MLSPNEIDQLARFDGGGARVLSTYLDLDPGFTQLWLAAGIIVIGVLAMLTVRDVRTLERRAATA